MSVFDQTPLKTTYRATIQFTGEVLGGLPKVELGKCFFHRLGSAPALHARQIKACLKEAASILGLNCRPSMIFTNRVFVQPEYVRLEGGKPMEPLVYQRFVSTAQGAAVLTDTYERLLTPAASFDVVVDGTISHDDWKLIWRFAEDIGIGPIRQKNYGKFQLTQWEA